MARAISAHRRDDGFTVVELVIAAAVLFFAMTALIGVLGASTRMTASAKSRSVLTNLITSEIEKIRALPYEKVAYESAGGGVPHSKTLVTEDSVTVTLSFTITDRSSQNYTKEITVNGVATKPGAPVVRYTTFAVFYDRIRGRTGSGDSSGPLIEFESETPPDGTVLDAGHIGGTTTDIVIKTRARSQETASNVTRFEYTVDGFDNITGNRAVLWLKETNSVYPGSLSYHDVPSPTPDESWAFSWNTAQVDSQGDSEVPDGIRTVTAIAIDDMGRTSPALKRRFLVDNHGPSAAPAPTLNHVKNADVTQALTLSWATIMDGTYPTDHYDYHLWRKDDASQNLEEWDEVLFSGGSKTAGAMPLAYYVATVRGMSVLGKPGPVGYTAAVVTSPILRGMHDVSRRRASGSEDFWTYNSTLKLDPPNIPYASIGSVIVERTGPGTAGKVELDVTNAARAKWESAGPDQPDQRVYEFVDVSEAKVKATSTQAPPEYRLVVTLTPAGTSSSVTAQSQYCRGQIVTLARPASGITNTLTDLPYTQRW